MASGSEGTEIFKATGGAAPAWTKSGVVAAGNVVLDGLVLAALGGAVVAAPASKPKKLIWSILFIGRD
jgi:hypothetical protein